MLRALFSGCAFLLLLSCKERSTLKPSVLLNPAALHAQVFTIDNSRDTLLKTGSGVLLRIPSSSFTGAAQVQLAIREAVTFDQMIRGGLLTVSNGKPLSSGGMIEVQLQTKEARIVKPIGISIPAARPDTSMQLFRGDTTGGVINWTDPTPLPQQAFKSELVAGAELYATACASCHAIDRVMTGPALANFSERGPWRNRQALYAYVRNPALFTATSAYAKKLVKQFGGAMMPSFPQLTARDIDAIALYVRSAKQQPVNSGADSLCAEACARYAALLQRVYGRSAANDSAGGDGEAGTDTASFLPTAQRYYQFSIDAPGWYNVDKYFDVEGIPPGHLMVRIEGDTADRFDVYLAVINDQVLSKGDLMPGKKDCYSFYSEDGSVKLPMGAQVLVFALDPTRPDVRFDFRQFKYEGRHDIELRPRSLTKEEFEIALRALNGNGLTMGIRSFDEMANDTALLKKLELLQVDDRTIDSLLRTDGGRFQLDHMLEAFRPKNCDCGKSGATMPSRSIPVR